MEKRAKLFFAKAANSMIGMAYYTEHRPAK
jgi:hypothetical protein